MLGTRGVEVDLHRVSHLLVHLDLLRIVEAADDVGVPDGLPGIPPTL